MKIFFRILTLIISSLIFSIIIAFTQVKPVDQQESNTHYFTFFELIVPYFVVVSLVYLIWGIPVSFIIDFVWRQIVSRAGVAGHFREYLIKLFLYIIGGLLGGSLLAVYGELYIWGTMLAGMFASIIFYHVLIPFDKSRGEFNKKNIDLDDLN